VRIAAAVEEVVAVVAMVADVQVVEDPEVRVVMAVTVVDPEGQGLAAMVNVQAEQDQVVIDPMVQDQKVVDQTDPLRQVYPGQSGPAQAEQVNPTDKVEPTDQHPRRQTQQIRISPRSGLEKRPKWLFLPPIY
jgi:hypothetical protein